MKRQVYAISVYTYPRTAAEAAIDHQEFLQLIDATGWHVAGDEVYQLRSINPATGFGTGKIDQLKELFKSYNPRIDLIALDAGFKAFQIKNIEDAYNIEVSDRTRVILEIFKKRATTAEGKLQVELAEAGYEIGRLVGGRGIAMGRLGGGIGTKGPGETIMEKERRAYKRKIKTLQEKLDKVKRNRKEQRKQRVREGYFTISLVGYTNAGKSTLLNALTSSTDVVAKNELFTTVDPTTRMVCLEAPVQNDRTKRLQQMALATDTVGFISRLPHELVEGFESTLEQVDLSDVVLVIIDIADPRHAEKEAVVMETLDKIHNSAPVIKIYNKFDLLEGSRKIDPQAIYLSASTGEGLDELKTRLYALSSKRKAAPRP